MIIKAPDATRPQDSDYSVYYRLSYRYRRRRHPADGTTEPMKGKKKKGEGEEAADGGTRREERRREEVP